MATCTYMVFLILGCYLSGVWSVNMYTGAPTDPICLLNTDSCLNYNAGDYIPDPYECTNYWVCGGSPLIPQGPFNCPTGEYFDTVTTNQCIADKGDICLPICGPPNGYCQTQCFTADLTLSATASNCSQYYICAATPILESCAAEIPYFDGVNCQSNPDNCCLSCRAYCTEADTSKEIRDPYNCKGYYFCTGRGFPTIHGNCSIVGQIWDWEAQTCLTGTCSDFC